MFSVPEQGNGELVRGGRPCTRVASEGRTARRGRRRRGCRGWRAQVEAGQEEEEEEGQNDENLGHPLLRGEMVASTRVAWVDAVLMSRPLVHSLSSSEVAAAS